MSKKTEKKIRKKFTKPIAISLVAFVFGQLFMELLGFSYIWHGIYAIAFLGLFLKTTSSHNSVFVFRVIVPVVIGLGMVTLYRYLYTFPSVENFLSVSKTNVFHLERMFELLSTLYAICTAFLLWKGLTDHDNIRQVLKDEAAEMQTILGFLNYLEGNKNIVLANKIRKNFSIYLSRIKQGSSIAAHEGNFQLLNETRALVAKLDEDDHNDKIAIAEAMKGLSNFFRIRTKRISYMETSLSPYILMALGFMSLSILYVVFTEPPSDFVVIDTIIFILSSLLSFMIMMLIDISSPFAGYWSIKLDAFSELQTIIDDEMKESVKT